MALFGKKKSEAPTASTAPASSVDSAFDFDAISRDLDAQNGASSFDALLSQPAKPSDTPAGTAPAGTAPPSVVPTPTLTPTDPVFDLVEPDPFQMTLPTAPVRAQVHTVPVVSDVPPAFPTAPVAPQGTVVTAQAEPVQHLGAPIAPPPTAVVNEPLSPAPVVVDTPPATPVQVPSGHVHPVIKPKKSLPIVPLLGGLGLLAVLGGGAMFLRNSQQEPLDTPAPVVRPHAAQAPAVAPSTTPRLATPSETSRSLTAPRPQATGIAAAPALRSGSPGIAPPIAATAPASASRPKGTSQIPVRVAQNPNAPRAQGGILGSSIKAPSATTGLDVGLASRLKALWQAGADAKHRHNYKEARASWEEALRLRPGHPGFAEAIAKLPR